MADIENIGKKIREIRKKRKFSQEKLAEIVSMNHRSILRLENSKGVPTLETINKIAEALEVNIEDFFQSDEELSKEEIIEKINRIMDRLETADLQKFYKTIYNFYN